MTCLLRLAGGFLVEAHRRHMLARGVTLQVFQGSWVHTMLLDTSQVEGETSVVLRDESMALLRASTTSDDHVPDPG